VSAAAGAAVGRGDGVDNDMDEEGASSTNASCGKRCDGGDSHPTCDVSTVCAQFGPAPARFTAGAWPIATY